MFRSTITPTPNYKLMWVGYLVYLQIINANEVLVKTNYILLISLQNQNECFLVHDRTVSVEKFPIARARKKNKRVRIFPRK